MKLNMLTLALAATVFGTLAASAQTTIIEQRKPPVVVIERAPAPAVSTTTEERGGFLGTEKKTTTETNGTGRNGDCATRTVSKEDLGGSKTVSRTDCQ
jgi:hypothetical protein